MIPDVLEPRRYDSHHDRSEAYWTERNALVDVIRAIGDASPLPVARSSRAGCAETAILPTKICCL